MARLTEEQELLFQQAREHNADLLERHSNHLERMGSAKNTRQTYLFYLTKLAVYLKQNMNIERLDIFNNVDTATEFVFSLNQNAPDRGTVVIAISAIKSFYKFLNKDVLPDWLKTLKAPKRKKEITTYKPSDIWSQEEVLHVIKSLDHPRDKALIAVLYDAALRPHELLKLSVGDVKINQDYAEILVHSDTKTGQRPLWLTFSYPYLIQWINCHPMKNSKNAPLWVKSQGTPTRLGYQGLLLMFSRKIRRLVKDKPYNPYILRHSRLTDLCGELSDQYLKQFAGWTKSSPMAAKYIHLNGDEIKSKLLQKAGILQPEVKQVQTSKDCPKCHTKNPIDNKFCECGFILSVEAFEEMKQKEGERDTKLDYLTKQYEKLVDIIAQNHPDNSYAQNLVKLAFLRHTRSGEEIKQMREQHYRDIGLIDVDGKHVCFVDNCHAKFDDAIGLNMHLQENHPVLYESVFPKTTEQE